VSGEVRYRESFRASVSISLVVLGGSVVVAFHPATRESLGGAAVGTFFLGFFASLLTYGFQRYGRIEVTSTHLRVGRDRIPVAALDAGYGCRDARAALSRNARSAMQDGFMTAAHRAQDVAAREHGVRLLGGAWGGTAGQRQVVVRDGSGTLLAIGTWRPDRVREAITEVLGRSGGP
jgi:hypothetical protein